MTIIDIARQLFPGFDVKVKESKEAARAAMRPAYDVWIRQPGAARGRLVFSITPFNYSKGG